MQQDLSFSPFLKSTTIEPIVTFTHKTKSQKIGTELISLFIAPGFVLYEPRQWRWKLKGTHQIIDGSQVGQSKSGR